MEHPVDTGVPACRSRSAELHRLPMLADEAPSAVRRALRGTERAGRGGETGTVWARVSELAAEDACRVAVVADSEEITYHHLCVRVRQIRAALLGEGCGSADRIAVAGPRGADTVAVFLAVESLGATYVPIDPGWPEARLAEVLENARPRCLFLLDALSGAAGSPLRAAAAEASIAVLTPPGSTAEAPLFAPSFALSTEPPDDEARYVIHTSGTTGRPKGAVVEQLGMMNHLRSMVGALRLTASDRVAFTAPPVHVISVWQMLAVLLVGGSVVVVPEADLRFARRLVGYAESRGITVMELVPTVVGWIVRDAQAARRSGPALPDLRCLVSTGERLDPGLAAAVLRALPQTDLLNAYGASECSDDVALHHVRPADLALPQLPAGGPLPGIALYLLVREDGGWRAAEPGEAGELWVGGCAVGAGYVNDPELTGASFFVDEFDPRSPTGRLYRTGDTAYFADGLVHCTGRADRQVKLAGVRVELDEVEAAVSGIPGVTECAVVAEGAGGEARLVAYYAAEPGTLQDDLFASLRSSLPNPMLPRRWVRLPGLPRNGNGKVDYRSLHQPSG
ncbi:amino acid adenylation domain-containing protein [Kitasatospora sp. NPDC058243]|uniref:amino acid adenylation domain-containing protein n=1 Tax=Kitasatospora sp. NPDC058243 TaxID=3346397 RepID=UPI0036DB95F5